MYNPPAFFVRLKLVNIPLLKSNFNNVFVVYLFIFFTREKMITMMEFLGEFLYYFIDNGVEIIELIMIFSIFFGMKPNRNNRNVALCILILSIFSIIWCFKVKNPVFILIYLLFVISEMIILYYEYGRLKTLLKGTWSLIFINIIDMLVYSVITNVFQYYGTTNKIVRVVLAYIIVFTFLFMLQKVISQKIQYVNKVSVRYYIVYLFIGIADFLVIAYVAVVIKKVSDKGLVLGISVIISLGMLFQYILVVLLTLTNEGLKVQSYLKEKYLNLQQENYEYLEMREEETKKFRHDYRNHLKSLQILCKENKFKELEQYIEDISERLDNYKSYVSVGNGFVDAILNYYYQKFEKSNISFNISGKMPSICNVSMFDLCTIISNLLDNAIEAVQKLDDVERWVDITFRYDNMMIFLDVINPYDGEVEKSGSKILSNKNSKNHGYGLINIKRSVEMYGGSMEVGTSENKFEVFIALVNKDVNRNNIDVK